MTRLIYSVLLLVEAAFAAQAIRYYRRNKAG